MSVKKIINSPFTWAIVGFIIGITLGVTTLSVSLLAIGFGLFLVLLMRNGPARNDSEDMLFASGPALMVLWLLGFIVRGILL